MRYKPNKQEFMTIEGQCKDGGLFFNRSLWFPEVPLKGRH